MGNWDIMCLGCYCDDGYSPIGYSAYEKVFMGWVEYLKAVPNTYYTLPVWNQKNKDTDKALCVVSDLNKNEYFIFENRRRVGWDRYLPGQGILVTHVTFSADKWKNNKPNNDDIQLFTLLPADNKLSKYSESGDTWPQSGKKDLTDKSSPATELYMTSYGEITGKAGLLGKPVTDMVINSDNTASFWFMKETHNYPLGDVNHDGTLSISDVTMLIDCLLQDNITNCCPICSDVDGNKELGIGDVTVLVDILLGGK
jgi:hypothetical protein